MREKYETLSLAVLRELAKARGLKGVSGLKKSDLIDRMVAEDEKPGEHKEKTKLEREPEKAEMTEMAEITEKKVEEKADQPDDELSRTERTEKVLRPERTDRDRRSEERRVGTECL